MPRYCFALGTLNRYESGEIENRSSKVLAELKKSFSHMTKDQMLEQR